MEGRPDMKMAHIVMLVDAAVRYLVLLVNCDVGGRRRQVRLQ